MTDQESTEVLVLEDDDGKQYAIPFDKLEGFELSEGDGDENAVVLEHPSGTRYAIPLEVIRECEVPEDKREELELIEVSEEDREASVAGHDVAGGPMARSARMGWGPSPAVRTPTPMPDVNVRSPGRYGGYG